MRWPMPNSTSICLPPDSEIWRSRIPDPGRFALSPQCTDFFNLKFKKMFSFFNWLGKTKLNDLLEICTFPLPSARTERQLRAPECKWTVDQFNTDWVKNEFLKWFNLYFEGRCCVVAIQETMSGQYIEIELIDLRQRIANRRMMAYIVVPCVLPRRQIVQTRFQNVFIVRRQNLENFNEGKWWK